jgi:cytochrome c-type biogenesis protein CcmH/NrfG
MVTPAAQYAFDHAAALAPKHPAPGYFLGLAYAQEGDLNTAERLWRGVLSNSPADAPWRPLVEERLGVIAKIRAAG